MDETVRHGVESSVIERPYTEYYRDEVFIITEVYAIPVSQGRGDFKLKHEHNLSIHLQDVYTTYKTSSDFDRTETFKVMVNKEQAFESSIVLCTPYSNTRPQMTMTFVMDGDSTITIKATTKLPFVVNLHTRYAKPTGKKKWIRVYDDENFGDD